MENSANSVNGLTQYSFLLLLVVGMVSQVSAAIATGKFRQDTSFMIICTPTMRDKRFK